LKIAISYKVKTESWGGGNQFAKELIKAAQNQGHKVVFDLKNIDIDIILLTDPRSYTDEITFGSFEIIRYLLFVNKKALVVHRINECDERKNTKHMNRFLRWSNYCADHTVFIGSWLKDLNLYLKGTPNSVILNGADPHIFKRYGNSYWDGEGPLSIVTHHWSPNYRKGFDIYKHLDDLLATSKYWDGIIKFTYIGNLPEGFLFKKTKHIQPISGELLGRELSKHHLYLSASINEPAGMHHIEGALCGLPIIYRESGALPEYCKNFGISFENVDYLSAIKEMLVEYRNYREKISSYPHDSFKMTNNYLNLFSHLVENRKEIVSKRNLFRSPILLAKNFLFLLMYFRNVVKLIRKSRQ
tara:strand:+ start:229 stop:1299 length:1071 start_codon:yes stop_codon:yes gene_type:complete